MNNLTGRIGHRVLTRCFRKPLLVTQVEVEGFVPEWDGRGSCKNCRWWIDATPNLLYEAERIKHEGDSNE